MSITLNMVGELPKSPLLVVKISPIDCIKDLSFKAFKKAYEEAEESFKLGKNYMLQKVITQLRAKGITDLGIKKILEED